MSMSKSLRQSLVSNAVFYLPFNGTKIGIQENEILHEQYYPFFFFFRQVKDKKNSATKVSKRDQFLLQKINNIQTN